MPSNILNSETTPTFTQRLSQMLEASSRADIAVGYFFLSGFDAVAEPLSQVKRIRILVGRTDKHVFEEVAAALQQAEAIRAQAANDRLVARDDRARVKREAVGMVAGAVSALPHNNASERGVRRLRDMIQYRQAEVRAYPRQPLHAKAYLCWYDDHAEPGAAVVGSSNFTLAGFEGNTELNVRVTGDAEMGDLGAWFDALWDDSEDIGPELVEELDRSWPLAPTPPFHVYLKALYELYGQELGAVEQLPLIPRDRIELANFQVDAVRRGLSMVENYGGCYIGDVVGLGKTFVGAELLRQLRQSYPSDGPPLILCPAGIVPMWQQTNELFGLGAEIVSHGQVAPPHLVFDEDLGSYIGHDEPGRGTVLADAYPNRGPVLVDEAHNFRNNNRRYAGLDHYLDTGEHKVVMMSATPQNLGPRDIYRQIRLFLDDEEHGLDIEPLSLEAYFGAAEKWTAYNKLHADYLADYAAWKSNPTQPSAPMRPKAPEVPRASVEEVLSPIFVRRRRMDIAQLYDSAEINGQPVRFPEPILDNIHYKLDAVYKKAGSFDILESKLKAHKASRYRPTTYLKSEAKDKPEYSDLIRARNRTANLMKALLFKRLESSIVAFRETLNNLATSNRNFRNALDLGTVAIGRSATQVLSGQLLEPEELLAMLVAESDPNASAHIKLFPSRDFNVRRWIADLDRDFSVLSDIRSRVEDITPSDDDKLQAVISFLCSLEPHRGKVLIFSESEATVIYLHKQLRAAFPGVEIERLTGSNRNNTANIIRRFAPKSNLRTKARIPGSEIGILVATDVVSEGQNLQDCNRIINYDLHWNPVRLIQRFGRIDRIGSSYATIHLHNTWPDLSVDGQLSLTETLRTRIQSFHDTIGLDTKLLSESERVNERAMYRIYGEQRLPDVDDDLDEISANQRAVATLQRIQDGDPDLWSLITNLPDGIRSALVTEVPTVEEASARSVEQMALVDAQNIYEKSPFDDPGPSETVVLMTSGNLKRCYAVGDDLQPRNISSAQMIRAIECEPDAPTHPLPENTNERVTAVIESFRSELRHGLGALRRRSDTRNRRYISRELNMARARAEELELDAQRVIMLRDVFLGDLPPNVDAEIAKVRAISPDPVALVRRLEAIRERFRLNPRNRDQSTPNPEVAVIKPLCSDALV